jgi:hypothetical protein
MGVRLVVTIFDIPWYGYVCKFYMSDAYRGPAYMLAANKAVEKCTDRRLS